MRDLRSTAGQRGFTVLEMIVVFTIIITISVMATIELQPTWQQAQANAAMDQTKSTLRQVRELAISQRRTIVVQFQTPRTLAAYQMQVQIQNGVPTQVQSTTPLMTVVLPHQVSFMTFTGELDTPDAYGIPTNGTGLYFAGNVGLPPTGVAFHSDGTFTDGNGTAINGTVFLGITNIPTTERAVTILGTTGRVHGWRGTGGGWFL